jgi:hypothetical protein
MDSAHQIESYRQKWINHLESMPDERIPKQVLEHKTTGRREQGRT